MTLQNRLFRAALRLLPAEFRGEYGREMEAMFEEEQREQRTKAGIVRLWFATLLDICRTAPAEHLDLLRRDLSYTLRVLGRRPALAITATLTLAIGIGANTAIFSVVNGVLLTGLPYPDADRLVLVQEDQSTEEPGRTGYFSFDALRSQQSTFDWLAAIGGWSATFTGDGRDPERIIGARVTWEFFRTLGVAPAVGRDFERQDDHPARRRQILLSDELWRRRFGSDPSVVGKPVTVNGAQYTIIGVMPRRLRELVTTRLFPGTEAWTLLGYSPELPQACRSCRHLRVIGRVTRGEAIARAQADLTRIYQALAREYLREYAESTAVLTPVRDFFLGPVRKPLLILWAAVGLLLLMTCANVANLLLIHASARDEEIAVRRALGVTPARLMRQLLTESLVLALLGGVSGAFLAWLGTRAIVANGPADIPRLAEVAPDARMLLYALVISVATGVIFGMAPARMLLAHQTGTDGGHLRTTRRATAGPRTWRYRATLVAVNVALSAVLLIGSGLLIRSFLRLLAVEPGFAPGGLLTLELDLAGAQYGTPAAAAQFFETLASRIRALPAVESVGASTQLPLTGSIDRWGITVEGRPNDNPAAAPEADRYGVVSEYFTAMNIPLLRGRLLTPADAAGTAPVVVIGKTMAEELWPGEDPIGHRVTLASGPNNPPRTIVGIVGDVRHYGLHLPPTLQAYMPQTQAPWAQTSMTMVIRVREGLDPLSLASAAREQVKLLDPMQPVTSVKTYAAIMDESMATRRFTLMLFAMFGSSALVLAVVGLYGALSYVVTQRRREIGVRVALGARHSDIRTLILRQGMMPVIAGIASGLIVSIIGARVLDALLFGVTALDSVTFGTALIVLAASTSGACALPAASAARIDPARTLHME